MTTILTKKKDTSGAPAPGDLTNAAGGAELAVNTADKRLYTKDSGGNVVEIGTNPTILNIDNIQIDGNTISSTNSNGNINLTPNGTGAVVVSKMQVTGALQLDGNITVGDSSADTLVVNSTITSNLLFTDNTYDIGANGATRPRNLFLAGAATIGGNLSVGGTLTLTGGVNLNGNVTVGDNATDTLTINSTITSNLIFTDNTYDIGASGATRPRNLFLAGNATIGGNQTLTGSLTVDSTTDSSSTTTGSIQTDGGLGVAKALYVGTTANIAGAVTLSGGTANGVAYLNGSKVLTTGSALTFDGTNLGVGGASPSVARAGVYADANGRGVAVFGRSADNASTVDFYNNAGTTRYGFVYADAGGVEFGATAGLPTKFLANGSEQMRLTSTGLGIGTSSPIYDLQVGAYGVDADSTLALASTTAGTGSIRFGDGTSGTDANAGLLRYDHSNNSMLFWTNTTERMRLDSSGNLGLGVTPSAWGNVAFDFGRASVSYNGASSTTSNFAHGAYFDGTNWVYKVTGVSGARYQLTGAGTGSSHQWFTAPSGTAGNAISFTQAMTLDASGNLGIGTTSPANKLDINFSSSTVYSGTTDADTQFRIYNTSNTNGAFGSLRILTRNANNTAGAVNLVGISSSTDYAADFAVQQRTTGGNFQENLRLTHTGNLGIGTASPSFASGMGIAVYNSTVGGAARIALKNGSTGDGSGDGFQLTASGVDAYIEQRENGFLAFTTNNTERARITSGGDVVVTGVGGLGYGTGSGGAVTQATSRTTGVTLDKTNGAITLVSAAGTTTWQTFTVTNNKVAATDTVIVNQKSGTDLYQIFVTNVAAGSFKISFATTGGTTTEQPVFNFAVIKAVTA